MREPVAVQTVFDQRREVITDGTSHARHPPCEPHSSSPSCLDLLAVMGRGGGGRLAIEERLLASSVRRRSVGFWLGQLSLGRL